MFLEKNPFINVSNKHIFPILNFSNLIFFNKIHSYEIKIKQDMYTNIILLNNMSIF